MGGMAFGRGPLLGVLALSAVLRILILSFDGLLWYDNPVNGHAYALVVFTVVDLVLMGVVVAGRGYRTVFIWAILQTLALALNPLTAFTLNITPADFASHPSNPPAASPAPSYAHPSDTLTQPSS